MFRSRSLGAKAIFGHIRRHEQPIQLPGPPREKVHAGAGRKVPHGYCMGPRPGNILGPVRRTGCIPFQWACHSLYECTSTLENKVVGNNCFYMSKLRTKQKSDLRAQPMPTKMMIRQTARPTNEIETISRTTTSTSHARVGCGSVRLGLFFLTFSLIRLIWVQYSVQKLTQ